MKLFIFQNYGTFNRRKSHTQTSHEGEERKAAFPIRQAWRIQKAEMPSAVEGGREKG